MVVHSDCFEVDIAEDDAGGRQCAELQLAELALEALISHVPDSLSASQAASHMARTGLDWGAPLLASYEIVDPDAWLLVAVVARAGAVA